MNFALLLNEYRQALEWVDDPGRPVHMVGIGGVGMAGLALLLHARGFSVSGCDLNLNSLTTVLRERGIPVASGHDPAHLTVSRAWAVRSAAVPATHPEPAAFLAAGKPVFRRGLVLPALMRERRTIVVAGTHGKTTTTGFLAQILRQAGIPCGFCVGGEIAKLGAVAVAENNPAALIALEADESDGTLSLYEADTAVITNIDFDHMENFADRDEFENCFLRFADRTRGPLIYGADDPAAARLLGGRSGAVSFGVDKPSDYRARIIEQAAGTVRFVVEVRGERVGEVRLPAAGEHNVRNALAALAAGVENGVPLDVVMATMNVLERPRRRFETLAYRGGRHIVSDYAHHPTEIRALMQSARGENHKRLLTVFQPHRYSRTLALGQDFPAAFDGADPVVLLPVYAASEQPLPGGHSSDLYAWFRGRFSGRVWLAENMPQVEEWLAAQARREDLILVAGAGSVEKIGHGLAARWQRESPCDPDAVTDWRRQLLQVTGLPAERVCGNWPLASRTTLGVGGSADLGVRILCTEELISILGWTRKVGLPVRVLGGGSNLLVSDLGVRGVVIRLAGPEFNFIALKSDGLVHAGGAASLSRLAGLSRAGRVPGFGFLAGIPGTVGGAVRMNAGAWGCAIGDLIEEIRGVDISGRVWCRQRPGLSFRYRDCPSLEPGDIVTSVSFKPPGQPVSDESAAIAEHLRRRVWMRGKATAGSVFRNPAHASAGTLLEAAGCKGLRFGGACVCREHANVIACDRTATASDVLALMQTMRFRVERHCGEELNPEIVRWI